MAMECEGLVGRDSSPWEKLAVTAAFPLGFQLVFIKMLYDIVQEAIGEAEEDFTHTHKSIGNTTFFEEHPAEDETPSSWYVIVGLTVFVVDIFTFVFGPSVRCFYAACQIPFFEHPKPIRTLFVAWFLFLLELAIGIAILYLGILFLTHSASTGDLLLNAVALHFIVDVDELFFLLYGNCVILYSGNDLDMEVPKSVVLDYAGEAAGEDFGEKIRAGFATLGFFAAAELPVIPIMVAILAYGAQFGFDTFSLVFLGAFLLVCSLWEHQFGGTIVDKVVVQKRFLEAAKNSEVNDLLDILDSILARDDIDVNDGDENGNTALHCAAIRGHTDITEALLYAYWVRLVSMMTFLIQSSQGKEHSQKPQSSPKRIAIAPVDVLGLH